MKHVIPTLCNELVCMHFVILERSYDGIENVLVITDGFTKWTKSKQDIKQPRQLPRH